MFQCLPFFFISLKFCPLLTLFLSLIILFLPSLFFFLFLILWFVFLLGFFAFVSWEEQLQNVRLERFLSSILSCVVFESLILILFFLLLGCVFVEHEHFMFQKWQDIKHQYINDKNNHHKRGEEELNEEYPEEEEQEERDQFLTQPWTNFWLNNLIIFGHFLAFLFKVCWNHDFIAFLAKVTIFQPTPKEVEALSVNTTALTKEKLSFSCILFFLLFLLCPVLGLSLRGMIKQKQKLKTKQQSKNKTTRCKQENRLFYK